MDAMTRRWPVGDGPSTISSHMSTRMEFEPAAEWAIEGKISFTYDGATPADPGPEGALLRMFIAQLSRDAAALKAAVTERTLASEKPKAPNKELTVTIKKAQLDEDGITAVVPAELMVEGQPQEITFIVVKEADGWKVDMVETMDRMFSSAMEQLSSALREGMQKLNQGLEGVMGEILPEP
jgi:hypothetical protein